MISKDLTTVTATGTELETATASPVTWTHMSESTPLPATDPLGGTDTAMAAIVTPVPRLRRKVAFQ